MLDKVKFLGVKFIMKLLIVDDEELTRNGLLKTFDWATLGIDEVHLADDGLNGLSKAEEYHPDIILCDVRMPRLDGIGMLERIKEFLPDISAIFMSGYSDKEYLMSAIKMGAINYIEKPIDEAELESAIHKAIEQCLRRRRESDAIALNTNKAADALAYDLTMPYATCKDSVTELFNQFLQHYGMNKFKNITTIIVKLSAASEASSELQYIYQQLRAELASLHMHIIYTEKRLYHLVYHIYSDRAITGEILASARSLMQGFFDRFGDYYIVIGDTVSGIENAYKSYASAVVLLQESFFFEPGTILSADTVANDKAFDMDSFVNDFANAIKRCDREAAFITLNNLYENCLNSRQLLPNQVKTVYFNMLQTVYDELLAKRVLSESMLESKDSIMDFMENCFSYSSLHALLLEKTDLFFKNSSSNSEENKTIFMIKNYIASNYSNSSLSVKDISDYAHLSVSYLCTFFKSETGTTLNQYITEYRMDKAKQLLTDPRNRITEISSMVGYNDGNYFGKSFRKIVGLSPSEYREKVMK